MTIAHRLARPEVLALQSITASMGDPADGRLHANECPWPAADDPRCAHLNWYPEPAPRRLEAALAGLYGVDPASLLAVRGSDEGIDLLVRTFARPGHDAILTCPPTFGMYAHAACIQGASVVSVPLQADAGFALDEAGVLAAAGASVRLVFLCTPNNPTGNALDEAAVLRIARAVADHALVVVDEAYLEFSANHGLAARIGDVPNLVVLRTLSKAMGLAGARCGAVIAAPEVIEILARVRMPYAIPTPVTEAVLAALAPAALAQARERIARIVAARDHLWRDLAGLACVSEVLPSAANFLLVRFRDAAAALAAAAAAGLHLRDLSGGEATRGCLRVTVGTPAQNTALVVALQRINA